MLAFLSSYVDSVFTLIQLEFFQYLFISLIGLSSILIIRYLVWGK